MSHIDFNLWFPLLNAFWKKLYLRRLFPFLFLLVLSQCFRFVKQHTKQLVYPPFNWCRHIRIRVHAIYLNIHWRIWLFILHSASYSADTSVFFSFAKKGIFQHNASLYSKRHSFVYIKNSNSITSDWPEQ